MIDFEWLYYQIEFFGTGYAELEFCKICDIDDYQIVTGISKSIASLEPENLNLPFAFFDLKLSDYDHHILSKVKIKNFGSLVVYSELNNLQSKITEFLYSTIDEQILDNIVVELAKLIARITSNIISASHYDTAIVSMLAYNEGLADKYYPCWHIDKTQQEELINLNKENALPDTQNVFIVTFKGPSTLYHHLDSQMRMEFNLLANESSHSYGYDNSLHYVPGLGLDKLFTIESSFSAEIGQGSVHLAGLSRGTVHATPEGKERLLFIVTPGDTVIIQQLKEESF